MRASLSCVVAAFVFAVALPVSAAAVEKGPKAAKGTANAAIDARAERYCAALHRIPAERRQSCCGGVASSLAGLCAAELGAALARGTVRLDEASVQRCAADSGAAFEGCGWITPLAPNPPPSCAGLVQGTLVSGAACRSSLECGEGLHCEGVAPGAAGVCRAALPAHARCDFPADNLAGYTRGQADARHPVCAGTCLKGQCIELAGEGRQCASGAGCASGLNCVSGRCSADALPALGESCGSAHECAGGAVCVDGTCAARKDTGASCRLPFECRSLACEKKPGEETGVCADACSAL